MFDRQALNAYVTPILLTGAALCVPLLFIFRYKKNIKKRLNQIEAGFKITRKTPTVHTKAIRCMELEPEYVAKHKKDGWQLISLGEYFSSLHPGENTPEIFLKTQFEITIGNVLLTHLGGKLGAALLPILGIGSVDAGLAKLSSSIANWLAGSCVVGDSASASPDLGHIRVIGIISKG